MRNPADYASVRDGTNVCVMFPPKIQSDHIFSYGKEMDEQNRKIVQNNAKCNFHRKSSQSTKIREALWIVIYIFP